jgi:hypothetical protein
MDINGVCYDVGRVYPGRFLTRPVFDLPWEPKQAFGAVASFYATH